jgi:hypothetical protein
MSGLAPFVAAVLRDNAVVDLLDENRNLRKVIDNTQIVEVITTGGLEGSVVWNRRLFTEGNYDGNDNVNLWCVKLTNNMKEKSPLPIHALQDLKLCVGGNVFATAGDYAKSGCLDPDPLDGDNQKVVRFFSGKDWLRVLIRGWPRTSWENFDGASHGLFYDFLYQRMVETISENYPEATVLIQDVSFLCESVSGLMLTMPPSHLDDSHTPPAANLG